MERTVGLTLGALGVLAFSMSLPATRVAVQQLDPWFVSFGRSVGAALLAWGYLRVTGAPRPSRGQWRRLVLVALGVVVGFPLFTSLALTSQTSAHGAIVITVLPAMTAVFAVLRAGERPPPLFWLASAGGLLAVLAFLAVSGTLRGALSVADLFLLAAVALAGLGYAEGGALARELGGARTICWALLLSLPATLPIAAVAALAHPRTPVRPPGRRSATSPWSPCSSASSPGTPAWPGAASRRSASSNSLSRCSPCSGRHCCSASTSPRPRSLPRWWCWPASP